MSLTTADAGHGGRDPGAVAFGYEEEDFTLSIAKVVDGDLAKKGINNYLTRVDDVDINPADRARKVRASGAKIATSIHINAGKGQGFDVIRSIHDNPLFSILMYNELKAIGFPAHKPEPYTRVSDKNPEIDYYFMIRDTKPVETLIVECGFIDNPGDLNYIKDPVWQKKTGAAIASAEAKYLEMRGWWKSPAPVSVPAKVHYAKVHNDELVKVGVLVSDHTKTLDNPATEGFVITLVNKLRKAGM